MDYLHQISLGIGVAAVLVIVYGVVIGLWRFVRTEFHWMRGRKRAVTLAGSLLTSNAPCNKTERGGRKAHRLEVEITP